MAPRAATVSWVLAASAIWTAPGRASRFSIRSSPRLMRVWPLKVFAPVSVSRPAPVLVRRPFSVALASVSMAPVTRMLPAPVKVRLVEAVAARLLARPMLPSVSVVSVLSLRRVVSPVRLVSLAASLAASCRLRKVSSPGAVPAAAGADRATSAAARRPATPRFEEEAQRAANRFAPPDNAAFTPTKCSARRIGRYSKRQNFR